MVVYGPIATARGSIVRTAKLAVIWVDKKAKGEPRADFTGAHEFGHHLIHDIVDHFAQCHGEDPALPKGSAQARDADKKVRAVEREATTSRPRSSCPKGGAHPGAAWGDEKGPGFLEHTINLGPAIGVMSWVVPLRA
jgi:hypothetical protein